MGRPSSWPLTQTGFITQRRQATAGASHPGLDIAVPADSYIRAAGAGTVEDAGVDEVYGRYILIDHGDGVESMYGHASRVFVQTGDTVERNEVIALSGSTGRSTAPHLHFEIRKDGEPVDPLAYVQQPS
jgi:murein DD-endopeptidase MepM/ murein hydrolase activator NlpD